MSADGLHRVRRVWAMRTASEYRSATLAAQYTHWLLRLGLPPDLVRQAMRVTSDELEHAERCFALSQAAGGAEPQAPVPETWLELGQDPEASLPLRALSVAADEYAVAESVALELFRAIGDAELEPPVRALVDRIVVDEARHAAFGWAAVDALLEVLGDEGRAWLQPRLSGYAARVRQEYEARSAPCTEQERRWGLMSASVYRELVDAALAGPVRRNLERRGLQLNAPG